MKDKAEINRWLPVEIKTILVPTDLRPESMIGLRYALTLAKLFDANLTLLHVLEEPYSSDKEVEPGVEGSLDPRKATRNEHWLCWRRICARSIGIAAARFVMTAKNIDREDLRLGTGARIDLTLAGLLVLLGCALFLYLSHALVTNL